MATTRTRRRPRPGPCGRPTRVTWSSYTLEGEAYEEPGISPDGSRAVWPEYQRLHHARRRRASPPPARDARPGVHRTATITDTGQVSYLYGSSGTACGLVALTRTGDAAPTRQDIAFEGGVLGQQLRQRRLRHRVVRRPRRARPAHGHLAGRRLVTVGGHRDRSCCRTRTRAGRSGAVSRPTSSTRPASRCSRSGPPRAATSARRSTTPRPSRGVPRPWRTTPAGSGAAGATTGSTEQLAVVAVVVRCGSRNVVLTTADAVHWQALPMGRHPSASRPTARYVAVPGRSRTSVISPERGVVTLPLGVTGRVRRGRARRPRRRRAPDRRRSPPRLADRPAALHARRLDHAVADEPAHVPRTLPPGQLVSYDLPYRFDVSAAGRATPCRSCSATASGRRGARRS